MASGGELPLVLLGKSVAFLSKEMATQLLDWTLGGSAGGIALLASTFWGKARNMAGLRCWIRRISLEKFGGLTTGFQTDPFRSAYYRAETVRDTHRRETAFLRLCTALALIILFAGAGKVSMLAPGGANWSAWLLVGCIVALPAPLFYFCELTMTAIKYGLPDHEKDGAEAQRLIDKYTETAAAELRAIDAASSSKLHSSLTRVVDRTPDVFQALVRERIGACIDRFDGQRFNHERECVDYLCDAVAHVHQHADRAKVDILSLCTDKTLGADHVERYWKKNVEAAKAGVYISRIFVFEPTTRDAIHELAQAQSKAGLSAYVIERAQLEQFLHDTYSLPVFGFTVVRGVDSLEEVVLHSGRGGTVKAAAYQRSVLTEYFAGIHEVVRGRALPARRYRPTRKLDSDRVQVSVELNGRTLQAVRLDYENTHNGCTSMSVALHGRQHTGRFLARDDIARVSTDSLQFCAKPMRVSHFHSVDTVVCRRRHHNMCAGARDGEYVVGLTEVSS